MVVEDAQRASVADAYHRWPPRRRAQQAIELRFGRLIERRCWLVHEYKRRLQQMNTGKNEPLLFAERQPLRPIFYFIQFACERTKTYFLKHGCEPRWRDSGIVAARIKQCAGESAERKIGLLRNEKDPSRAEPDFTIAERPNSGDRPQQRTLSRPGQTRDQHRFATSGRERYSLQ